MTTYRVIVQRPASAIGPGDWLALAPPDFALVEVWSVQPSGGPWRTITGRVLPDDTPVTFHAAAGDLLPVVVTVRPDPNPGETP